MMDSLEKSRSCCNSRNGSAALGITMTIMFSISALACFFVLIFLHFLTNKEDFYLRNNFVNLEQAALRLVFIGVVYVGLFVSLAEFALSIVLAEGALKKKVTHLQVYVIYGATKSAIAFMAFMVSFSGTYGPNLWSTLFGYLCLVYCALNTLIIAMVYCAYTNLKKSKPLQSVKEEIFSIDLNQ